MNTNLEKYGLLTHYPPSTHKRIRRLMLEDWKAAGVKLPTYMKLVARYIESTDVTEEWLSKLSHQTMDKMLKQVSVPRYEFWACLHLYLIKKYGPIELGEQVSDEDILGQALTRFGGVTESITLSNQPDIEGLVISAFDEKPYAKAKQIKVTKSDKPFGVEKEQVFKGVIVIKDGKATCVMRDIMTKELSGWTADYG